MEPCGFASEWTREQWSIIASHTHTVPSSCHTITGQIKLLAVGSCLYACLSAQPPPHHRMGTDVFAPRTTMPVVYKTAEDTTSSGVIEMWLGSRQPQGWCLRLWGHHHSLMFLTFLYIHRFMVHMQYVIFKLLHASSVPEGHACWSLMCKDSTGQWFRRSAAKSRETRPNLTWGQLMFSLPQAKKVLCASSGVFLRWWHMRCKIISPL